MMINFFAINLKSAKYYHKLSLNLELIHLVLQVLAILSKITRGLLPQKLNFFKK